MKTQYIKELPEDAKKVEGAENWVDRKGNVYGRETRIIPSRWKEDEVYKHKHYGEYFKVSVNINNHNGYCYAAFKYYTNEEGKYKKITKRVHKIIAQTFIENPNDLPIVGHKNNIKSDNRVENLYWTTASENTQKAVDDGLLVNDKGRDDSQSQPVIMFNTYTNEEIGRYGSMGEAARAHPEIGVNTISRQCKYKRPVRKPFYFRFEDDLSIQPPEIVFQYDYNTDEELGRYWNTWEAARQTGFNYKTIGEQCNKGWKPKIYPRGTNGTYFLRKKI